MGAGVSPRKPNRVRVYCVGAASSPDHIRGEPCSDIAPGRRSHDPRAPAARSDAQSYLLPRCRRSPRRPNRVRVDYVGSAPDREGCRSTRLLRGSGVSPRLRHANRFTPRQRFDNALQRAVRRMESMPAKKIRPARVAVQRLKLRVADPATNKRVIPTYNLAIADAAQRIVTNASSIANASSLSPRKAYSRDNRVVVVSGCVLARNSSSSACCVSIDAGRAHEES